jgi:hypothetical protein
MINLEHIDKKINTDILSAINNDHIIDNSISHTIGNNYIYTIDNFLTVDECDSIIKCSEKLEFEQMNWRNSQRVIIMEENKMLETTIKKRLNDNKFLRKINNTRCTPYGFNSTNIKWNPCKGEINECFRINKYEDGQEFIPHRDAQYVKTTFERSNYTLLTYLNDDYDDGETIFHVAKDYYVNNGYTIEEEMKLLDEKVIIKPKRGMAVIFCQRCIHEGNVVKNGTKYVLRTDIMKTGTQIKKIYNKEDKIYNLCKGLFKQAQIQELYAKSYSKSTNDLYDICIGLRQTPHAINYPDHLEQLLSDIKYKDDINPNLTFESRNGLQYTFSTTNGVEMELLKQSYLYTLISSTIAINNNSKEYLREKMEKICGKYVMNYDKDIISEKTNIPFDVHKYRNNKYQFNVDKLSECDNEYYTLDIDKFEVMHNKVINKTASFNNQIELIINEKLCKIFDSNLNIHLNTVSHRQGHLNIDVETKHLTMIDPHCQMCNGTTVKKTHDIIDDVKISFNNDSHDVNIKFNDDTYNSGKISINCEIETFNHASCQCTTYCLTKHSNKSICIDLDGEFLLSENKIIITIVPQIVL